jgi:CubicO group peptidase (beta-lactamase class C family)
MSRMRSVVVALLCWPTAAAQDTVRMEQVIQSFTEKGEFTGTVLVARGSDMLFSKAYGHANREEQTPNTAATKFRVASITKQFTAAAILLLEERGKLKIDDPVKKYLPEAPASWDRMTIFHLLTHTAGLPGLGMPLADKAGPAAADRSLAAVVARLMERPLSSAPGEIFTYGNAAYFVLGHLIQKISGQSYEAFLQENVFVPLGMRDSGLENPTVLAGRATHYTATPQGVVSTPTPEGAQPSTAAGMISTAGDLLRWQVGLFSAKVLSQASLKKMTTPFKGDYGLGVYVRTVDGRKAITHGGGAPPFANLTYFPDSKITVVVLGNLNISPANELAAFAGALAHGDTVALASEKKAIDVAPEVLAKYVGVYDMGSGQTFTIALEGSGLTAQPPGGNKLPMLAESETMFFFRDMNVRVEFIKDSTGAVTEMVIHQGTRQTRLPRAAQRPKG